MNDHHETLWEKACPACGDDGSLLAFVDLIAWVDVDGWVHEVDSEDVRDEVRCHACHWEGTPEDLLDVEADEEKIEKLRQAAIA